MARAILPSRMLIAVLGVTVIAGLAVIWIKSGKTRPADPTVTPVVLVKQPGTAKPEEPVTPPVLAAVAPAGPTTAPTSRPTALPMMAAVAPAKPTDPISAAKARTDAGDVIAARKILNDALLSKQLTPDQATTAKQEIASLNEKIIFSATKYPADPFAEQYTVKPGDRLVKIAAKHDMTVELLKDINGIKDERKLQAGKSLKIINGPFTAVVSKGAFTIDLWLGPAGESGSMYVKTYRVALGKDDGTPLGTWMVEAGKKQTNPKFWGARDLPPMEADDPKNPLGEYWIGLVGTDGGAIGQTGYGIHGTIEPESIGKNASMGCIRLINEEAAVVFKLLVEGKSTVIVVP